MGSIWLIANGASASTDEAAIARVRSALDEAGKASVRLVDLQNEEMPPASGLPDVVAVFGGDGTVVSAVARYGAAQGTALLVLPGGTMNLVSAMLHGADATPEAIIASAFSRPLLCALPHIEGPDFRALTGLIAGSTVRWGDVREELREGDIGGMLRAAGDALDATMGDADDICLEGLGERRDALFVRPTAQGLEVEAILAGTLGGLAQHGLAWLRRDFLGGPTERVASGDAFTLSGPDDRLQLLVDGERCEAPSPLPLRHGWCPARFLATVPVENARRTG